MAKKEKKAKKGKKTEEGKKAEEEKKAKQGEKADKKKETDEQEKSKPEKGKGGKPPLKLIVPAIIVLLLLGGGVFAWKSGVMSNMIGGGEKAKVAKKIKEVEKAEIGPVFPLDAFIVNLMDPLGKRYLKVKITLELSDPELEQEVDRRLPQIRDGILTLLSSKSFKDVNDLSGKYQLRAEILGMLNGYMKTGKVRNIYFTEFIVQ